MNHVANVYPHHDLLNMAFYQLETIQQKIEGGISDALALDCMACLISLGIGLEALINFCGYKIVPEWNEGWQYPKKLKKTCRELGIEFNETDEPLSTLKKLRELRNQFAHAKPIRNEGEVKTQDDLNKLMSTSWDHALEYDFVLNCYKKVKELENVIYLNKKVLKTGVLTSASGWSKLHA